MSSIIKILPDSLINKIAAGEVVERPASVVKELIENAIDAGATEILIEVEQAGRRLIRITDNGSGMSREDARLCFNRHATSKITDEADLDAIRTMGFRGEALSSIASVSQVRLVTAAGGTGPASLVEMEGGRVKTISDAAAPRGTSIEVCHLFYNTPARLKFLKSNATEFSHILSVVSRQAMARQDIRFRLMHNKNLVFDLSPCSSRMIRVLQLYGKDLADNLVEFGAGRDGIFISGLISRPAYTRADRTYQDFYVNGRFVKSPSLSHALYAAYSDMLMRERHPACFIFIEIAPGLVDVNVHPAKAEVRFRNQSLVHDLVRDVIREGLRGEAVNQNGHDEAADLRSGGHAEGVREAVADYLASADPDVPVEGRKYDYPVSPMPPDSVIHASSAVPSSHHGLLSRSYIPPSPLAQIHDSFIIAQSTDGMVVIDQHAAHERVLFEKLQDLYNAEGIPVQYLLIPEQVEFGPSDSALLSGFIQGLTRFGLYAEDFGAGTFVIKAVPYFIDPGGGKGLLQDILDELRTAGESARIEAMRDRLLSVMACRPAIKVNRRLELREMEALIRDLFACRMPYTCPHGRPTVIRFSMDEIKKMFKR